MKNVQPYSIRVSWKLFISKSLNATTVTKKTFRLKLWKTKIMCLYVWISCCDVRYNFRIKTMFGSSLSPVVCRSAHVLFTLFVFVCAYWCPTHIVLCFYFVLCNLCCQFLWIIHFVLRLRYSIAISPLQWPMTLIHSNPNTMHNVYWNILPVKC